MVDMCEKVGPDALVQSMHRVLSLLKHLTESPSSNSILLSHHASSSSSSSPISPSSSSSVSSSSSTSSSSASTPKSTLPRQFGDNNQFVIRFLEQDDFQKGFLGILTQLALVGPVKFEEFSKRLKELRQCGNTYNVVVIEDTHKAKIVACATLLLELKFIHKISSVAHVEDVVVDKQYRGFSLGLELMQTLRDLAVQYGCYKILLDCDLHNVPFYNKSGYSTRPTHMVNYLKNPDE